MKITRKQLGNLIKEEIDSLPEGILDGLFGRKPKEFSKHHEKTADQVFNGDYDPAAPLEKELGIKNLVSILDGLAGSPNLDQKEKKDVAIVRQKLLSLSQMISDKSIFSDRT